MLKATLSEFRDWEQNKLFKKHPENISHSDPYFILIMKT